MLGALRAPGDVAEAAELITSELVTNSVKYGRARLVRVAVDVADGKVTITVSDTSPYVPLPAVALPDAKEDENGRGLVLVDALAARWGHRRAGPGPDAGTAVWAELPLPEPTLLRKGRPSGTGPARRAVNGRGRPAGQGRCGRTRPDS